MAVRTDPTTGHDRAARATADGLTRRTAEGDRPATSAQGTATERSATIGPRPAVRRGAAHGPATRGRARGPVVRCDPTARGRADPGGAPEVPVVRRDPTARGRADPGGAPEVPVVLAAERVGRAAPALPGCGPTPCATRPPVAAIAALRLIHETCPRGGTTGVLVARGRSADRPQIAPAVIVLPARGPSQPGRRALVRSAPAPE